ncbi:Rrf2 family transcriptional regulator [Solimonas sp. K1W22B-7]|uniref:RrF2 family transcriptional regulator n=1 Tax=Solimonas sp. K1W22B-7 TaxID=2303331 RepID=UPI000E3365A5|nr:Rrf2 family transcriptional regulator [Solimonas sp. K1W22B-7]AXQ27197.1 Rrf2 family transcriptional regulator [Solimonas sp. K1W22B-7]
MVLKSQVEWALHCCAILSGLPAGKFLATRDLAELHGLPKEYLSKALQGLSQAQIVTSTLGPSGGYRLARAAKDITFLDIVEAIEGNQSTFVCTEIRKNNPCRKTGTREGKSCAVARVMWKADQAWRASLRDTTLADLGETLAADIPPALYKETFAWVTART